MIRYKIWNFTHINTNIWHLPHTKEVFMKDSLLVGLAVGALAGALYVSNNKKAQQTMEKGKKQLKKQLDKLD